MVLSGSGLEKWGLWWSWGLHGYVLVPLGAWLAGLLLSGEVFLWNKDRDFIKTVAPVPAICEMATMAKGRSMCVSVVSCGDT